MQGVRLLWALTGRVAPYLMNDRYVELEGLLSVPPLGILESFLGTKSSPPRGSKPQHIATCKRSAAIKNQ
jgi:hypothetical protein